MQTLYLIDGHAQFYRAYHAIRNPMSSPVTKEPTNATFGFIDMLLKLFRVCEPDYVAVAYDISGDRETFRSELYPEYKATRSETPSDLVPQMERCLNVLRAIGVPVLAAERYEADDVIATIARRIGRETPEIRVRIVSKDKDLQQLLVPSEKKGKTETGGVEMFDVHDEKLIDVERLREDKGVTPEQVVDMLALMGDTSDNIPGVPGVGIKTAAQLISEFGTLDAVLEEATAEKPKMDWKIKGKRRENIAASADQLGLSKKLVTLVDDVDLNFELDDASASSFDLPALLPILKELGFNRHQDELKALVGEEALADAGGAPSSARPSGFGGGEDGTLFGGGHDEDEGGDGGGGRGGANGAGGEYETVLDAEGLGALAEALRSAKGPIAFDTETNHLRARRAELVGMSFSVEAGRAWYVPVKGPEGEDVLGAESVLGELGPILEDASVRKTGHNLKYDTIVMRRAGVTLRGIVDDTMVSSYLIDASRSSHSMDALAQAELGVTCVSLKDLIGTGKKQITFDAVPLDKATEYAAEDADVSLRLHERLSKRVRDLGLGPLFEELELPLVSVLAELEYNGIRVDASVLHEQREELGGRIDALRGEIVEAAPREFNPDSPVQLRGVLFNKPDDDEPGLGISTKGIRKTKTGHSTDAETLQKLAEDPEVDSELPRLMVDYRQLTKLVNTYLVALEDEILEETGRIHASFNQTVAATGRLSSSDPNLQNIPIRTEVGRRIRKAFVAEDGCVLVSADYSQIALRVLAHLSRDENLIGAFCEGADIHRAVAAQIHGVPESKVTKEQRAGAKQVNFGIVYGITAYGLARRIGISSSEASEIIEGYKARFTGIARYLEECVRQARDLGYVSTILGRRRPIPDIEDRNAQRRSLAERMAINTAVQGSAADLIKLAMLRIHRELRPWMWEAGAGASDALPDAIGGNLEEVKMLLQIHDELVFECPAELGDEVAGWIRGMMESAMEMRVPLRVETGLGRDWFEGEK